MTDRDRAARTALWLVGVTVGYNAVEAAIALWAGVGAGSVALVGFGLDSVIELAAGVAVLARLSAEFGRTARDRVAVLEHRVHRFVGWTFLLLAAYVTVEAVATLWLRDGPAESVVGLGLAALSLVLMPLLAMGKLRMAAALASRALRAEAKETLACAYLSACLLVGLGANAAFGWWWADPVAALAMVPWLVHEGREALEGDQC